MARAWGHLLLLAPCPGTRLRDRARLVARFAAVDWTVPVAHTPAEAAVVARAVLRAAPPAGSALVEAGCWRGGLTAKLSLVAAATGTEVHVLDSFLGVEPGHGDEGPHDFTGEYAATEADVRATVAAHGDPARVTYHPGWFRDTAAAGVGRPVALLHVDCDLASGTAEVLAGLVPHLLPGAVVLSQDTHLAAVRAVLADPATWEPHGLPVPRLRPLAACTSRLEPRGGRWIASRPPPHGTQGAPTHG